MGIAALNQFARETCNVIGKCWPWFNVTEAVVKAQAELSVPSSSVPLVLSLEVLNLRTDTNPMWRSVFRAGLLADKVAIGTTFR
jgi:hypothetical protein